MLGAGAVCCWRRAGWWMARGAQRRLSTLAAARKQFPGGSAGGRWGRSGADPSRASSIRTAESPYRVSGLKGWRPAQSWLENRVAQARERRFALLWSGNWVA